jgi:hypothetical protein
MGDPPDRVARRTDLATFKFSEAHVEALYMARTGVQRRPTCVQLERMMKLMGILARVDREGGFLWTWPKLARAMRFDVAGLGAKEINRRFQTSVERTMRYLVKAGLVDGWEVAYRGREPIGILVALPAGVAQSVRASRSPRARGEHLGGGRPPTVAPRCSPGARRGNAPSAEAVGAARARRGLLPGRGAPFFSPQSVEPSSGGLRGGGDSSLSGSANLPDRGGARAERALGTRERAQLSTAVYAALERRWREAGQEGGAAVLEALPALALVDVDIVAREALRLELELGDQLGSVRTLAISSLWQERMGIAAAQLDRHARFGKGQPGAAAAMVIDLVRGDWRDFLAPNSPPRSLGAIAVCLRRVARRWRRGSRRALAHA